MIKICLCTPMYGGLCYGGFMSSVLQLQSAFKDLKIDFTYLFVVNESLINRARNKLCKYFLNTDYTHLLFIDADIEFRVQDILNMIKQDKDIIGCAYAIKDIQWNKISESAKKGITDPNELKKIGTNRVFNYIPNKDISNNDFVEEVLEIGTGIMLIKRNVFKTMIEKNIINTSLLDSPDVIQDSIESRKYYVFFDTLVDGNRYLSEDYMFCKKWRDCLGKIYLLKDTVTKHWGNYAYEYSV